MSVEVIQEQPGRGVTSPFAISVVQHAAAFDGVPANTTLTVNIAATGAGHLLVMGLLLFDINHRFVTGVSDGLNAFTQFPSAQRIIAAGTFDGVTLDVWYLPVSTAGRTGITLTTNAAPTQYKEAVVWEIAGFTSPVTDGVVGIDDKIASGFTDLGEALTTLSRGFLIGYVGEQNNISVNPAVGNIFIAGGDIVGADAGCSLISSIAGTYTPAWTSDTSGSHFCSLTAGWKE